MTGRHEMTCSTCHPLHARGRKRGRGTMFGLICFVFSQTLTFSTLYQWGRNVEIDTLHRGRDSVWVNIDMDTHKGQSLT